MAKKASKDRVAMIQPESSDFAASLAAGGLLYIGDQIKALTAAVDALTREHATAVTAIQGLR